MIAGSNALSGEVNVPAIDYLRPAGVDGFTFGRRVGVHDLNHGSTRLRIESFIGVLVHLRATVPTRPVNRFGPLSSATKNGLK
jgi:hypothetical protein